MDARVTEAADGGPKVELILAGDSELDTLIVGLRWTADKLEELKNAR